MTSDHWKDEPEKQDYPAARSYLSLLVDPSETKKTAKALADDPNAVRFKAKDILRAAGLPLLPLDDPEVAKDLAKVTAGTKLSPVLLVRDDPLCVADGWRRALRPSGTVTLSFDDRALRRVHQQARNTSIDLTEQANPVKFLLRDRDTKFTASVDAVLAADGTRVIKTPIRAPRANATCERVIGTIRREHLDRMLILGRRHLEAVLAEYVEHDNSHRPHRPLSQRPPAHWDATPPAIGDADTTRLRRADRLGGLIHEYRKAA